MTHDPLADFITRLKNASLVGRRTVTAPHSRLRLAVAELLQREGYLTRVVVSGQKNKKSLMVDIAYNAEGRPAFSDVQRWSKPSRRVYLGRQALWPVRRGRGRLIVSTSQGVMTGEAARRARLGGEALFAIW